MSLIWRTPEERITLLREHIRLFTEFWEYDKSFDVLKKFFKVYISGWPGAKELRIKLMATKSLEEVDKIATAAGDTSLRRANPCSTK